MAPNGPPPAKASPKLGRRAKARRRVLSLRLAAARSFMAVLWTSAPQPRPGRDGHPRGRGQSESAARRRRLLGQNGRAVSEVRLITDRDTGRPRGFGFVEMESSEDADAAIRDLNGADFGGRALTVNEARERTGGGGGGYRRGY